MISSPEWEKAMEAGKTAAWIWNYEAKKLEWSLGLSKLHSLSVRVNNGDLAYFTSNIHPFDKERFTKKFEENLSKPGSFRIVYRILLKNEAPKYIELRGKTTKVGKGIYKTLGTVVNITELKVSEKRTEKTVRRIEAILKNIPEGITVEFASGEIVYANDAALKLFGGQNAKKLKTQKITDFLKKFEIKDLKDVIFEPKDFKGNQLKNRIGNKRKTFLFTDKKNDSYKYLRVESSVIETEDLSPELYTKVFQNVTKEIEEKLNTQVSLGVTSHELRNALTGLKGYIHLVKRRIDINDSNTAALYLNSLSSQSDRIIKLINDLFDVSRIRLGFLKLNKKEFDYTSLLNETIESFQNENIKIKISRRIDPNLIFRADRDRITQVLYNFLTNAIKYGGKEKRIQVSAWAAKDKIVTSVKDYGIGIPRNKVKEIFKLYRRLANAKTKKTKGLGVGLFISQGIVIAHGGAIKVVSKEGKGSIFSFSIPRGLDFRVSKKINTRQNSQRVYYN